MESKANQSPKERPVKWGNKKTLAQKSIKTEKILQKLKLVSIWSVEESFNKEWNKKIPFIITIHNIEIKYTM